MTVKELIEHLSHHKPDKEIFFEIGTETYVSLDELWVGGDNTTFIRSLEWKKALDLAPFTLTLSALHKISKESK